MIASSVPTALPAAVVAALATLLVGGLTYLGQRKTSKVTENITANEVAIDGLDRLVNQLQKELANKRLESIELHERCRQCEKEVADMRRRLEQMDTRRDELEVALLNAQNKIRQLRAKIREESSDGG